MFKCGKCKRTTLAREKPKRVVVEITRIQHVEGSYGDQIVREELHCQQCAREMHTVRQVFETTQPSTPMS